MVRICALLSLLPAVAAFQPRGAYTPLVRSEGHRVTRQAYPNSVAVRRMAVEDKTSEKADTVLDYTPIDVEVSDFEEWKIKFGFMDDPRIPEECRVDTMTKIKSAGTAGVVSYALTELTFWVISVPLAVTGVAITTGSVPDLTDQSGQAATAGYAFVFLNFARAIVPFRIALALALTPWVDDNIMSKFKKEDESEDCEVL